MLLHLMRWLRQNTDLDFDLLLRRGGDLAPDYSEVCTVFQIWRLKHMFAPERSLSGSPRFHSAAALRWILARRGVGLVYSNTIRNGRTLAKLALRCPLVCHVHEVELGFRTIGAEDFAALVNGVAMFITISDTARASLIQRGVLPQKVVLVPGFTPVDGRTPDPSRRIAFRRRHGIPEDAVLVGGCGRLHWQKGPDLLVHVARLLAELPGRCRLHFAWLGGQEGDLELLQLRWDIERAGLADRFTLVPSLPDPLAYFDSLDMLALTSRDDPLPLVAVEAGARAVPIVYFEGNAEFADPECGVVVPYLDLQKYAKSVRDLADDEDRRAMMGRRLATKVRDRHDVSVGAPQIASIIRSFVA